MDPWDWLYFSSVQNASPNHRLNQFHAGSPMDPYIYQSYDVDGNPKNPANLPVDMVNICGYLRGILYIQTVVGLGISEASTSNHQWVIWIPHNVFACLLGGSLWRGITPL